ncbi:hypothetical protein HanIR_Chr01g0007311 [Helianthus annuus]|nr:hypothetical protein HanIR_Chr01g0007311 [Helianthus annuus]
MCLRFQIDFVIPMIANIMCGIHVREWVKHKNVIIICFLLIILTIYTHESNLQEFLSQTLQKSSNVKTPPLFIG